MRLAAQWITMAALATMGAAKLADLPSFVEALKSWSLIPKSIVPYVGVAVPAFELLVSAVWLFGVERRWSVRIALCWLVFMVAAYSIQLVLFGRPVCGCMGRLNAGRSSLETPWFVLGRSGVMIVLLGCGRSRSSNSSSQS